MPNTLPEIVRQKRIEIEARQSTKPFEILKKEVCRANRSFLDSITKPGLNVIAEIKPRSPSAGMLKADLDLGAIIPVYSEFACAISVLTDEKFFGGSYQLLAQVKSMSNLPVLCKEFILHPYQCYLARLYRADAVLLIAKILREKELAELYSIINDLGMLAAIEVQNHDELEMSLALRPRPRHRFD